MSKKRPAAELTAAALYNVGDISPDAKTSDSVDSGIGDEPDCSIEFGPIVPPPAATPAVHAPKKATKATLTDYFHVKATAKKGAHSAPDTASSVADAVNTNTDPAEVEPTESYYDKRAAPVRAQSAAKKPREEWEVEHGVATASSISGKKQKLPAAARLVAGQRRGAPTAARTHAAKKRTPDVVQSDASPAGIEQPQKRPPSEFYASPPLTAEQVAQIVAETAHNCTDEQKLMMEFLLSPRTFSVFGLPGTGKSFTLVKAMKYMKDTWVFTEAGTAADNLIQIFAETHKMTGLEARAYLKSNNVLVKHYAGFFSIPPRIKTYHTWKKNTQQGVHDRITLAFDRPPRRLIFEECCTISSTKYEMIGLLMNHFASRAWTRRNIEGRYDFRFMGVENVAFVGDPRQLVPTHPGVNRIPDRLMDTSFYQQNVVRDCRLALTKQLRQTTGAFQGVITNVGRGCATQADDVILSGLKVVSNPGPNDGVVIYPKRKDAIRHNHRMVESMPDSAGDMHVYEVKCEFDVEYHRKIHVPPPVPVEAVVPGEVEDEDGGDGPASYGPPPPVGVSPVWKEVTLQEGTELYKRIITHGKDIGPDAQEEIDYADLASPVKLRLGVPVLYGLNDPKHEHLRNGTYMRVVGFNSRGYPYLSLIEVADRYFEENGEYGFYEESLSTKTTVLMLPTVKTMYKHIPGSLADGTSGKTYYCRLTKMDLWVAFACTVHKVQGRTFKCDCIVDPSHQFANGILYVALTRSRNVPKLLRPWPKGMTIRYDKIAVEACNEIEANMPALCEKYRGGMSR